MVATIVVPLLITATHLLITVGDDYYPTLDWALLELHTTDVSKHLVTVGPHSRFGWNHPGPLLYYLLYVPYKIFGSSSIGLHVSAALINAAAVVGCGLVAFRRGGLVVAVAVLVPLGLMVRSLGPSGISDPWNPHLPVISFLLLLLLAWSVTAGDLWLAPIAAALASFTIQSHAGMLPLTAVLAVIACGVVCGRGLRVAPLDRRAYWKKVAAVSTASAAVVAVLWLPVIYGTFVVRDGNLGNLFRFFTSDQTNPSLMTALDVLGLQWGPLPEWIFGERGTVIGGGLLLGPQWWVAVGALCAGVATTVVIRKRDWDTIWLAVLLIAGTAVSLYAITGVVVPIYPYLVRWTWVLGAGLGVLVLLAAWAALPERALAIRPVAVVALIALALLGAATTVDAFGSGVPSKKQQTIEKAIAESVLAALPPETKVVLVEDAGGSIAIPGLVSQLARHGIDADVSPFFPIMYGSNRRPNAGPYRTILRVFAFDGIEAHESEGKRVGGWSTPRTPAENRILDFIIADLQRKPSSPDRDERLRKFLQLSAGLGEGYEVYLIERVK